jgi:hypothetical protein
MRKSVLLKIATIGWLFSLLCFLAACTADNGSSKTVTPTNTQVVGTASSTPANRQVASTVSPTPTNTQVVGVATQVASTASPTVVSTAQPAGNKTGFAAIVYNNGNPVNRDAQGQNLTTIHSPVDRPVAKFTLTTLNVPPKAQGVVYIQNDSDNPQTLVSDTAKGFPTFTIAPNTSSTLVFYQAGTFKAHLNGYPVSADTSITIIITYPMG